MIDATRRLATILSADLVPGGDASGGAIAAAAASATACHEVLRRSVVRHGGRTAARPGRGTLATFTSILAALQCAVDVRELLEKRNRGLKPEHRVLVRIGIHLGDCVERDDGAIEGKGVSIAEQLRDLAEPGGICISASTHELIEGKTDYRFDEVGDQRDGKSHSLRAFALRVAGGTELAFSPEGTLGRPSIAVLPFDNLSGDKEDEYFADGIVEDLITALSRIRWLMVIARNSTFTYKGQPTDVKRLGRDLGVRYVLEGSVRRAGGRVRITAQLIEAKTGGHIWARHYDRELVDIFSIQDEITRAIVGEIEPELGEVERELSVRKPPENLTAWDIYQHGLWHMWKLTASDNEVAQRHFTRATEIDPHFAPALAGLAYSRYMDSALAFREGTQEDLFEARRIALTAISIDAKDAMAHCTLGRIDTALGEHTAAVGALETAIELNPSFALAHHGRAMCLTLLGRAGEAIPEFELATRLSPRDPYLYAFQVVQSAAYNVLGQYARGEECARQAANHPSAGMWAFAHLAQALAGQDRIVEARSAIDRLLQLRPDFSPKYFARLWPNCSKAFTEPYFDLLAKAGLRVSETTGAG